MPVEVGGYELSPALASGMEQASFDVPPDFAGRIAWFELSNDETPQLSPSATRVIERLQTRHIVVEAEALAGSAFWQTQEIEENEALLQRSLASVARAPSVSPDARAIGVAPRPATSAP